MGPARIGALIGGEDEDEVQPERDQQQPLCLAQHAGELRRQGRRFARRLAYRGQGLAPCYSGSMIVSRSTIWEPRISMYPPVCRSFITRLTISREAPIIFAMSCLGSLLVTTFSPSTFSAMSRSRRATRP